MSKTFYGFAFAALLVILTYIIVPAIMYMQQTDRCYKGLVTIPIQSGTVDQTVVLDDYICGRRVVVTHSGVEL